MNVMSSPSRRKSWQSSRERVSVLAALAIQKETVSRVLAELREQHKPPGSDKPLSQEKAAHRAGITVRQWQRWEAGASEPYLRNIKAVADAFGRPVSDFFDADELEVTTSQPGTQLDRIERKLDQLVRYFLTEPAAAYGPGAAEADRMFEDVERDLPSAQPSEQKTPRRPGRGQAQR